MSEDKFLISVIFHGKFSLEVTKKMTIKQLKDKVREKVYIDDPSFDFKFFGEMLHDNTTLENYKIKEGDTLLIFERIKGGGGYFGIDMADISNEKGKVANYYNKNAPKWNKITEGLNLTGNCENRNCEAYGKVVDCKIGLGTFDLVGDCDQAKCPMCKKLINLTTCTFCECQYKLEGKKKTKDGIIPVNTSWKRVEKDYEYYDPIESGIVTWVKLIIQTKSL